MFFSLMAYMFLALIYNAVHADNEEVSLISTVDYLNDINIDYAIRGKSVMSRLEFKSDVAELMGKTMKLENMIRD